MPTPTDPISIECERLARYLLGVSPPGALVDRYRAADAILFPGPFPARDRAILEFARRRPWSLAYLDAALGFLRPDALLRKKVILMLAILETSPDLAPRFEPEVPGAVPAAFRLGLLGISGAFHVVAGAALLALVVRPPR